MSVTSLSYGMGRESLPYELAFLCERVFPLAPDYVGFVYKHGRVPLVEAGDKPWEFQGWLFWTIVMGSFVPGVVNRWDYWYRTATAGRILEEPIPRIEFRSSGRPDGKTGNKHIEELVDICRREGSGWSAFSTLVDFLCWSVAGIKEYPRQISDNLAEKLYRKFTIEPFLKYPSDYLGTYLTMSEYGRRSNTGFFPTPHEVCECMAQIGYSGMDPQEAKRQIVNDCCAGTLRLLMHASNYSLRLYAQDCDRLVVKIAHFNAALYVPWIVKSFPDEWFKDKETL